LANFVPAIVARSDVYEVAIGCGYAMTMLALVGVWKALHEPQRRWIWLAAASVMYGLALGARPSLLFGAVILLVPVAAGLRNGNHPEPSAPSASSIRNPQSAIRNVSAALGPISLIGLALLAYNAARFGSPFEFGQFHQTPAHLRHSMEQFDLRYLWFNFRVGFLAPAHWSGHFPFVKDIAMPPTPAGYWEADHAFGILTNVPLVWLALAAPLAWRGQTQSPLAWLATALFLLFATCTLTLGLHDSLSLRYEIEITHWLVLLAVMGIFGLERRLVRESAVRRWMVRSGWILLVAFSIAFNLLASSLRHVESRVDLASALLRKGKVDEAVPVYEEILRRWPDHLQANLDLGSILLRKGQIDAGIAHFQRLLRVRPDYVEGHINLGMAAQLQGRTDDAIAHFQKALEIQPVSAETHYNLANIMQAKGQVDAAVEHYEIALKTRPDFASAHHNLAMILFQRNQPEAAATHFRQIMELEPENVAACRNLALALIAAGKTGEAIRIFERALMVDPRNIGIADQLAFLLATSPDASVRNGARAVELANEANRLSGGNIPEILRTLAAAYAEAGRFPEAIASAEKALELATAQNTALMNELRGHLALYESRSPLRVSR